MNTTKIQRLKIDRKITERQVDRWINNNSSKVDKQRDLNILKIDGEITRLNVNR